MVGDVKMLQSGSASWSGRPWVRSLLLCIFFLGLFSMHVLGAAWGSASGHEGRDGSHSSGTHVTVSVDPGAGPESLTTIQAPGHIEVVGLGECTVAGACALCLLLAFRLARPVPGAKVSRAWPLSRFLGVLPRMDYIPAGPSPLRLGISRR